MYLGIDLGTSGVKAILMGSDGEIVAVAQAPLHVSRPHPLMSEQDPADWWTATRLAVTALPLVIRAQVQAVGLSGQMHGAVLLDEKRDVLRPAILWNDGRSGAQCEALEKALPTLPIITGNRAMPGFTAPKLLWVARYEPEIFAKTDLILLPKDWLRLKMTGQAVSDMSDAAGTLWLDVGARDWSDSALAATGLARTQMPRLVEGSDVAGTINKETARAWGIPAGVLVAGSAGDNAASAVGMGLIKPGQGFISLGTSGVIFVTAPKFAPNSAQGVHSFCHALPSQWHWMSVILSASSAIDWAISAAGFADVPSAMAAISSDPIGHVPIFLPYLSGERTPHNDPHAMGAYIGLSHMTSRVDLVRAALEGVAFALANGLGALETVGDIPESLFCVGGGSRMSQWLPILASVLNKTLLVPDDSENAAALGAARLARLALGIEPQETVCPPPTIQAAHRPDAALAAALAPRHALFKKLYPALKSIFQEFPS
jgi:xylulokinase